MRLWLQTRSESADYRFLGGAASPERWWSGYLHLSAPENAMILIETRRGSWRLYATAMDSGRRDGAAPPRPIRNSLVVEGDRDDANIACGVLEAYFSRTLERELAHVVSRDVVDRAFGTAALGTTLESEIAVCLRRLSTEVVPERRLGTWGGPSGSSGSQQKLAAALMAAIGEGRTGVFGYLNLMSDLQEGDTVRKRIGMDVGVFLFDHCVDEFDVYRPQEAASGANPSWAGAPQAKARPGRTEDAALSVPWTAIVAIVVAALVLLGLVCATH